MRPEDMVYRMDPDWLQWTEVIVALALFATSSVAGLIYWYHSKSQGHLDVARLNRQVDEARETRDKRIRAAEQANCVAEDKYPTARIPARRLAEMDDTMRIVSPLRPYVRGGRHRLKFTYRPDQEDT